MQANGHSERSSVSLSETGRSLVENPEISPAAAELRQKSEIRLSIVDRRPPTSDRRLLTSRSDAAADWLLWQLSDSAFPIGGFAHSAGLEAAWQHGEVDGSGELVSFADASIENLGHASLPFVTVAHDEPDRLMELSQLCDAFTTNHVANRASRLQGRALASAVERIFNVAIPLESTTVHFAPAFGAIARRLGILRGTTVRLFLFNHMRAVLAAAVRLNIVGPMEAQAIQFRFGVRSEEIAARCELLTLEDIAQTSPLLELWQGGQDRLYSRLFQS